MEKKKDYISRGLVGIAISIESFGFIHSFAAATETYESWSETKTVFDAGLFFKYFFTTLIITTVLLSTAAIVHYLFNIQNHLELLTKGKTVIPEKRQEKVVEKKEATNKEILDDLLEKGCITQDEYIDACNRELMKTK